jgi:hypothetical protein
MCSSFPGLLIGRTAVHSGKDPAFVAYDQFLSTGILQPLSRVYLPRHGRHQAAVLLAAIGAHTNRSIAMSNRVSDAATWILKTAFDWRPSTACQQSTPFGNTSRAVDCCLMEQRGLVLSAQR